jgi:hypothetical protein
LPGEAIHNKPYRVTPERVVDAIKTANTIGIEVAKQYPKKNSKNNLKLHGILCPSNYNCNPASIT